MKKEWGLAFIGLDQCFMIPSVIWRLLVILFKFQPDCSNSSKDIVFTKFDLNSLLVTLTFDIQNLIRSSVEASEYSLSVYQTFSSHGDNIWPDKQTN